MGQCPVGESLIVSSRWPEGGCELKPLDPPCITCERNYYSFTITDHRVLSSNPVCCSFAVFCPIKAEWGPARQNTLLCLSTEVKKLSYFLCSIGHWILIHGPFYLFIYLNGLHWTTLVILIWRPAFNFCFLVYCFLLFQYFDICSDRSLLSSFEITLPVFCLFHLIFNVICLSFRRSVYLKFFSVLPFKSFIVAFSYFLISIIHLMVGLLFHCFFYYVSAYSEY